MTAPLDTPLQRQLVSILAANREDSYATQRKRGDHLANAALILHSRFGLQKWDNLKQKHVEHIIHQWKQADQGRRAIDEKVTHLRWLVRKIGKANLMPKSNAELGIEPGPRHTRAGKIISDADLQGMLAKVVDPHVRAMMLLARYLGLRFEEASLFRPGHDAYACRIWVKRGTKGGRPRHLFLYDRRQVEALEAAGALTKGDRGLIPETYATYEQWRQHVYPILRAAGLSRESDKIFHDLRRTYIVERMRHLVTVRCLSREDSARLVAREVGHNRTEVLNWYMDAAASSIPQAELLA